MRLKFLTLTFLIISLMFTGFASACELTVQMVNQDPYPAVPGDYVTAVFQVVGVSDPDCGLVSFTLIPQFPFSLDPGVSSETNILGGTYGGTAFESFLIAPYKIRVDEKALDGNNKLDAILLSNDIDKGSVRRVETFEINIEAADTDFEVSIRDFKKGTQTITFEILNVGENDIEALTIEIPKQETITVKGSNRNIVGSLDSNEDTTFSFEATPKEGEIKFNVIYTDNVNVRRQLEKSVQFDPEYFTNRVSESNGISLWFYVSLFLILIWLFRWYLKNNKKKKSLVHHKR